MEPAEIHQYLSQFQKCDSCEQVFPAEGGKYVVMDVPAPCCGAPGPRGVWPDPAIAIYIETARRQHPNEEATPRIRVLMLAAAAELMMEHVLWAALARRISNVPVALAMMDRCQGIRRLKDLFKDLTGQSVGEALKTANLAEWGRAWEHIAGARNGVAHGQWDRAIDDSTLARFADSLIPAGAVLWNAAVSVRASSPEKPTAS